MPRSTRINARLPFLTAQLAQLQLRSHVAEARTAIRDTRFEDAANAIATARALNLPEAAEIDAVSEELSTARSEQRVDETLALAGARLEEGDLLAPANDNARYYYELVLANDPANTSARQGLDVIASKLVLQARSEIDAGNLDAADDLLADARAIDASSAELTATEAALRSTREAIAARERRAAEARREAERRAAAERQAAAERAEAERRAQEEAAAAASAATVTDDAPPETADDVVATSAATAAATTADEATADDAGEPVTEGAQAEPVDVRDPDPVAVSSLTRIKYVAPRYPRSAERRRDTGWVDIVFTVALDGTVKDVEVRNSQPGEVFDNAAVRAVEKWRFEPVIENGVAVEKRAGIRMMFALQ